MSTSPQAGEQRTLLRNITWQTFLDLCEQRVLNGVIFLLPQLL